MAVKNQMIMSYVLRQFKNTKSSIYKRWLAYVNSPGTLSTRGLAQHMVEHGLVADRSDVEAMLTKLSQCVPELVAQGYGVKLEGIGIFRPTIKNAKGGADSVKDFTVERNIEGVRFNFVPDSTDLDDLTYKAFKKHVSFGNGYYQTESGRKAPLIPLAAAGTPAPDGD